MKQKTKKKETKAKQKTYRRVHHDNNVLEKWSLFKELRNEKFITLDKTYMLPGCIENICKSLGFVPNIVMESSQWDFIAEMIALNRGIAILPKPILERFNSDQVKRIQ